MPARVIRPSATTRRRPARRRPSFSWAGRDVRASWRRPTPRPRRGDSRGDRVAATPPTWRFRGDRVAATPERCTAQVTAGDVAGAGATSLVSAERELLALAARARPARTLRARDGPPTAVSPRRLRGKWRVRGVAAAASRQVVRGVAAAASMQVVRGVAAAASRQVARSRCRRGGFEASGASGAFGARLSVVRSIGSRRPRRAGLGEEAALDVRDDGSLVFRFPKDASRALAKADGAEAWLQRWEKAKPGLFTLGRAAFGLSLFASLAIGATLLTVMSEAGESSSDNRRSSRSSSYARPRRNLPSSPRTIHVAAAASLCGVKAAWGDADHLRPRVSARRLHTVSARPSSRARPRDASAPRDLHQI